MIDIKVTERDNGITLTQNLGLEEILPQDLRTSNPKVRPAYDELSSRLKSKGYLDDNGIGLKPFRTRRGLFKENENYILIIEIDF